MNVEEKRRALLERYREMSHDELFYLVGEFLLHEAVEKRLYYADADAVEELFDNLLTK